MAKKVSKEMNAQKKERVNLGVSSKGNKIPTPTPKPEKEKLTKKQIIILISVFLAAVIVATAIVVAVFISRRRENPDFMKSDLSKYITVSEDDYKGYVIDIPLDSYNDLGVQRKINMLLTKHKTLNEYYKGKYPVNQPLTVGNNVNIYFRGYTVDENGRENDFDGGSNLSSSEESTIIEVGTGNIINEESGEVEYLFIPGFGEALVGLVPSDYSEFKRIRSGRVMAGDVIYLSYKVTGPKGERVVESERIDLSLPYIDEKYGEGFTEFFIGKTDESGAPAGFKNIDEEIGEHFECKFEGDGYSTVYMDMRVDFVTRGCENNPITLDLTFPANYSDEAFRGKAVKFDVYIRDAVVYDVAEFNDAFIKEKLKVKEEELSAYKGESLVDKYTEKLREEYKAEIEESNHALLVDRMWAHIISGVEVKRLPKATVETYYNVYYNQIKQYYSLYSDKYSSIDKLAVAYLNSEYGADLADGGDWKAYITDLAEGDVLQKIVFYYIIREENLLPSDSEYRSVYDRQYNEMLDYYLQLHESELSLLSGDAYNKKVEEIKKELDAYYGDSYFKEQTYYYYGSRKMLMLANIK